MTEFTDNWERSAHDHIERWREWTGHMRSPRILEIGSYEGRSAIVWLSIHPTAEVTCVDPFGGTAHGDRYEARFDANTKDLRDAGRIKKLKGKSTDKLVSLSGGDQRYDIIYVDGDHTAAQTLLDACLAWPMLNPGGVMIFDDYEWKSGGPAPGDTPRLAVDLFELHFSNAIKLGTGWQVAFRKVKV